MIEYLEVWRIWEGLEATEFKLYLHKKRRLDIVFFSPSHSGKNNCQKDHKNPYQPRASHVTLTLQEAKSEDHVPGPVKYKVTLSQINQSIYI
jgi:hypothetical protein